MTSSCVSDDEFREIEYLLSELSSEDDVSSTIMELGLLDAAPTTPPQPARYAQSLVIGGCPIPELPEVCGTPPPKQTIQVPYPMPPREGPPRMHAVCAIPLTGAVVLPLAGPLPVLVRMPASLPLWGPATRMPRNFRKCIECGETETPKWREELCNSCGLKSQRKRAKLAT